MMTLGYRSNDVVLTVCQNNRVKSIEISEINKIAEDALGYASRDLAGKPLSRLLPPRIDEMLREYVEFGTDANDVGQVLSKVQSFSVIGKDGKESGYRLKVVRADSTGDKLMFKLVLQDRAGLRKNEALRKAIQENFKGHEVLDPAIGLPDRASLGKDIELMGYYSNKSDLRSCCGILQFDHYDDLFSQYGRDVCSHIVKHIAQVCRLSLRPDDVVGSVSYKRLGVLLLDTTPETGRMVFNRLRWQIAANPFSLPDKTSVGLSVSVSFIKIGGRVGDKSCLDQCDAELDTLASDASSALLEVEESDKN